jgi:hypothetical protein
MEKYRFKSAIYNAISSFKITEMIKKAKLHRGQSVLNIGMPAILNFLVGFLSEPSNNEAGDDQNLPVFTSFSFL